MKEHIDVSKLIAEIKRYKNKADERLKIKGRTFSEEQKDLALQNLCGNLLYFITSLQQEQPDVDLDREIIKYKVPFTDEREYLNETTLDAIANHFYELGFNAGKSAWHSVAEEIPTENCSEIIVACRNKNKEDGIWLYDLIQCWEGKWEPRVNWETPVKWAYVRDLFNARKEE